MKTKKSLQGAEVPDLSEFQKTHPAGEFVVA